MMRTRIRFTGKYPIPIPIVSCLSFTKTGYILVREYTGYSINRIVIYMLKMTNLGDRPNQKLKQNMSQGKKVRVYHFQNIHESKICY